MPSSAPGWTAGPFGAESSGGGREAVVLPAVVLFDLGGVLMDFAGFRELQRWLPTGVGMDEIMRRWLLSPTVRDFERGALAPGPFAEAAVREFQIAASPAEFLLELESWLRDPYPGAAALLVSLQGRTRLALLSNTNAVHWGKVARPSGLAGYFEVCFPSHVTGRLKPDADAFTNVSTRMGVPVERILFLDDSPINVAAAIATGMQAEQVRGVGEARAALVRCGLLPAGA